MQIYLAAPLFSLAERAFNAKLRDELVLLGHDVFLPQESEENKRKPIRPLEIAKDDKEAVERCDALIAILDGSDPDSGTSLEVGMAIALGKMTVGIRTDFRASGDDAGIRVNLMFLLMERFVLYDGPSIFELAMGVNKVLYEL